MDDKARRNILIRFGSVKKAFLSLLDASTGNWYHAFNVAAVTPMDSLLFMFFVILFELAVWNVVTSIFVEKALKLAQPDVEATILAKNHADVAAHRELCEVCRDIVDVDHSGKISWEEFLQVLTDPTLKSHLDVRGIDIHDAEGFFAMLTALHGQDEVEIETFVAGCLRMKGNATSVDLQTLRYEVKLTALLVQDCIRCIANMAPDTIARPQSLTSLPKSRGKTRCSSPSKNVALAPVVTAPTPPVAASVLSSVARHHL